MRALEGRVFDHVVIIVFENEFRSYVMKNGYMRWLASQGIDMANYFGVMHPSNPNYLASIAGEVCGVTADPFFHVLTPVPPQPTPPTPLEQRTLPDLIAESGLSWKAYMETYFTVDFPPRLDLVMDPEDPTKVDLVASAKHTILDYAPYLNDHNPFVRFRSIMENREQWQRIETAMDFLRDALDGTLPEYSWLTPDIWSNGHWLRGSWEELDRRAPPLVDQLAKWLKTFFGVLRFPGPHSRLPANTLVVLTFDESDFNAPDSGTYEGPNQIYTVLLGDGIEPGVEEEGYNHYSLLRTIERNFGLGDLGKNDAESSWFRFLWGERFDWGPPQEIPELAGTGVLAGAGFGDALFVVYRGAGEELSYRVLRPDRRGVGGSQEQPIPVQASAVDLAALGDELWLFYEAGGGLSALTYTVSAGWSDPRSVVAQVDGSFAVTAFLDYADRVEKLMLVYQATGGLQSTIYAGGAWSAPVAVGQSTDGDLVLAVLGASIFLIYQAAGDALDVVSYNTADFNVVTAASADDDTTQGAWSPGAYPVQHFARRPGMAYKGRAPLAAATLDGVVHLAHPGLAHPQVVTETFSVSGVMTAASTAGNGYGTLAEAGWSRQTAIAGAHAGGVMFMSRLDPGLLALVFETADGRGVQVCLGKYCVR